MIHESLSWLYRQTRGGAPRSLERMRLLRAALQIPEPEKIILVAGTNGKGTITTALGAAFTASSFRTGTCVSPHVERFNERIAIDGVLIPDDRVIAYTSWLQSHTEELATIQPTFFELTLAMALKYFADEGVEYAVIECGVGVQYDATNALDNVIVSVVSNVAEDHVPVLGTTLLEIAHDKAHAVRSGITTLLGVDQTIFAPFAQRANAVGGILVELADTNPLFDPVDAYPEVRLAAATARHLNLPDHAVSAVFTAPRLPARRERFALADGRAVILDGAHNLAAAQRLVQELPEEYVLLFSSLAKKDYVPTHTVLAQRATAVVTTQADPFDDAFILESATAHDTDPVQAMQKAMTLVPEGGTLVIAGSFYLAGAVRESLRQLQNLR